jgi:hypothetical protein
MAAGDIYTLLIVLTAIFVAPFNMLALIIVVSWMCGHFAYVTGLPEPWINLIQHIAASALSWRCGHRGSACLFAWALFVPLIVGDLLQFTSVDPRLLWWSTLLTATAQLVALPFGADTRRARRVWARYKLNRTLDRMRNLFAGLYA